MQPIWRYILDESKPPRLRETKKKQQMKPHTQVSNRASLCVCGRFFFVCLPQTRRLLSSEAVIPNYLLTIQKLRSHS